MILIYLRSTFSGALRKTTLFLREGRFGGSRASKVNDVEEPRKTKKA